MAALYCLMALVGLIATYLLIIYFKEFSREEESIKELLKSQKEFAKGLGAGGAQPLYFDLDQKTLEALMKSTTPPAEKPITKETTTGKKKIIN